MLFIKNGYVKPMIGADIPNGCILVDNGKILAVGAVSGTSRRRRSDQCKGAACL